MMSREAGAVGDQTKQNTNLVAATRQDALRLVKGVAQVTPAGAFET
jgi:hypothetical protein